jgi:hypothetical protein
MKRRAMIIKLSLCMLPLVVIFVGMIIREFQGQLTPERFLEILVLLLLALGNIVRILAPDNRVALDVACLCRILAVVCAVISVVMACLRWHILFY